MHKTATLIIGAFLFGLVMASEPSGTTAAAGAAEKLVMAENGSSATAVSQNNTTSPNRLFRRGRITLQQFMQNIGVDAEAAKLYAKWFIGAPALVLFILILMLLRPRPKMTQLDTGSSVNRPTASASRPSHLRPGKAKRTAAPAADTQQVLQFFLRLFKHQQNLEPDAATQLQLIEHRNSCPHDTYEMGVRNLKEWVTRRMSIGLLGQGGGSRSRCFYVIYDSHLVIKIPAEPIADFDAYNRQIANESRIVSRLSPRLCIVPRVAVILKAICAVGDGKVSEEEQEKKYIELLKTKPAYQEYLKLGGSFAFFMDLAKYFFLSTTMEEIHRGQVRLIDEIQAFPDLLWDHNGFVGRYGEETGAVCHDLQNAFRQCEIQLHDLIDAAKIVEEVPGYIFKQWFLSHLAGEKISADELNLREGIIEKADQIIDEVLEMHRGTVDCYRTGIGDYIRSLRFFRYHRQLENLASNMLDLLAWIIRKDLALRDLKPENLFVAGNPKDYPIFLNDRSAFSIGLIDVETAVVLDGDDPDRFPQPQLAGTPLYATPAHLLSNTILKKIYGDLRATLQLQDWHATIAILFKLITGQSLFARTAHVFPEIVNQVKTMDHAGAAVEEQVVKINRLYWNSAQAEFQEALHKHQAATRRVAVGVPELLAPQIGDLLSQQMEDIDQTLSDLLNRQSFFNSEGKLHFLKHASAQKIGQMKNRLVQERDDGRLEGNRSEALMFFKQLELLKREQKRKQSALNALQSPCPSIPADQLLDAMFLKVFRHMYPPHWPALNPSKYRAAIETATDITTYQATL